MAVSHDKRELILARLPAVFAAIDGVRYAARNEIEIPETKYPAIIVLDSDEVAEENPSGRVSHAPQVVNMTPEIYILLKSKAATVGTELNAMRAKLIKAVLTDNTLVALCKDGEIRYDGIATGLAAGRSMAGEAGVSFTFRYVLQPQKL